MIKNYYPYHRQIMTMLTIINWLPHLLLNKAVNTNKVAPHTNNM